MRRWLAALLASALPAIPAAAQLPVARAEIVKSYPHDPAAFTEGLLITRDGRMFESTGLEGQSDIREVRLSDGKVLRRRAIPPELFGEGIVDVGDEIVSVTWQTGVGFRWGRDSFMPRSRFRYTGEGWGMTRSAEGIVLSDGTPTLRVLDPKTFAVRRRIAVTAEGRPVRNLNELEMVDGELLANVWQTDLIVRIDPKSGTVKGAIDLSGLPRPALGAGRDVVANGIAWDAAKRKLYVTGKNWPKLYEIRWPIKPH